MQFPALSAYLQCHSFTVLQKVFQWESFPMWCCTWHPERQKKRRQGTSLCAGSVICAEIHFSVIIFWLIS